MDTSEQEKRHLDNLMQMDKPVQFGASFVQRNCKIGYNNAIHVLELGVRIGILIKAKDNDLQYVVMNLIDTPFEQIKPAYYDRVITELQKVKNELTDLAERRADLLLKTEAKIEKMNAFIKPLIKVRQPYHSWLKPLEEIYFKKLMELKNNNQSKVTNIADLNRGTIRKKLKLYNLI